jgi:hypothetical protein
MLHSSAEVAVERPDRLIAHGHDARPAALARDGEEPAVQVDRIERQPQDLAPAGAGVHEYPQDRLVTSTEEGPVALARLEQATQLVRPQNGRRGLRQTRRLHVRHRRVPDLAFLGEPPEEGIERAVAVMGRRRLPPLQEVRDERLDVLAGDRGRRRGHASLGEKCGQLAN